MCRYLISETSSGIYVMKAERNSMGTHFVYAVTFFSKQSRLMLCGWQLNLY